MSGLFSTLNVGTRGMSAQQKAIDVTSHNIANANTEGYSRQRAIMETTTPFGMPSINNAAEPGQLGTGVQITAIQRLRDSFLDYQVRVETSTQGQYDAREKYLSEIEGVFNEPTDNGISTLVDNMYKSWQTLSTHPNDSNARTIVAQTTKDLTDALNHTSTQLDKIKQDTQDEIKQSVFDINGMLNQLDQLNQQIIGVNIAGNMPNDLMDKRDLLLDQLSSKFNIQVDKQAFLGIDVSPVDKNGMANGNLVQAANNSNVMKFSYVNSIQDIGSGQYKVTFTPLGDVTKPQVTATISMTADQATQLDENRVVWANSSGQPVKTDGTVIDTSTASNFSDWNLFQPTSGELKGYMSVQHDVDGYQAQMDKLAKALAFSINSVESGTTNSTADSTPLLVNNSTPTSSAGESTITARNITVNTNIISNPALIQTGVDSTTGATDGTRALAIAQLRDTLLDIQSINTTTDRAAFIGTKLNTNGLGIQNTSGGTTVGSFFKDVVDKLGVQSQEAQRIVKNQGSLLASIQQSRDSVSGVSIDEEMASLIQYQHAYQANAKIISTVDELLDVVINGLKK